MARVVISASADSDRGDILDYLAANAGYATAERYNGAFKALNRRLADFPDSGPPPNTGRLGPNRCGFPLCGDLPHSDDTVTTLRILHGKRDITRDLLKP